jgi:hypothetical protein
MRNFKYVIAVGLSIFLGACSSDDSDGDINETPLVVGTYTLTEVNVSIAQDPNEDGTFSINMVDELSCLNGTLAVSADGSWNMTLTDLNITTVTGDFYPVFCGESQDYAGTWSFQNNILNLNSTAFSSFSFTNSMLVENINEDLPGILNRKFEKQ